jgi:hypothetical protein
MPKSIVPSPAAVVAVDRLTLQATDARATDHRAAHVIPNVAGSCSCIICCYVCFSEE